MLCSMLVDGRPRHKPLAGRGRGSHKGSYGTARPGDRPTAGTGGRGAHTGRPGARRPRGPGRASAVTPPSYPRRRLIMTGPGRARAVNRHGRTNLGPLAARPHLSPVPDRLPGRPTSDPGGPGLRRLYGYFRGGVLPEREQPVCRFTEKIRRLGAIFHPCFLNLSPGQPFFVKGGTKLDQMAEENQTTWPLGRVSENGCAKGGVRMVERQRRGGRACCVRDDSCRRSAPGCGRDESADRAARQSAVRSRRSRSIR